MLTALAQPINDLIDRRDLAFGDLFFAVQDECGQDFIFTRHDVGTASWAGEVPVLPLGEAQPAVTDIKRFEVVRDQHPFNRDVLLQSAA